VSTAPPPADLLPWALEQLGVARGGSSAVLDPVAGDASSRRYFRLDRQGRTVMLVHAPPATQDNAAFVAVRALLAVAGVRVPAVIAVDPARGFLLLEDLGDTPLLSLLDAATVDRHYARAGDILLQLAATTDTAALPRYDESLLREELSRFDHWCLGELLGAPPDRATRDLLARLYDALVDSALAQPRVLVHRDFHSRNLMVTGRGELALIDFQDAVCGPLTYDAVSLLRDCYIRWPAAQVDGWALCHRERLRAAGVPGVPDAATFLAWFDCMGLQRHLKVLGTFARLSLRDGKPGYLRDLPRVNDYIVQVLARRADELPAAADFLDWYRGCVAPHLAQQLRGAAR